MSCYFHRKTKGHRSTLLLVIASHENQDLSEKDSCLQGSTLNTLWHGHQAAFLTANLSEISVRAIFKSSQIEPSVSVFAFRWRGPAFPAWKTKAAESLQQWQHQCFYRGIVSEVASGSSLGNCFGWAPILGQMFESPELHTVWAWKTLRSCCCQVTHSGRWTASVGLP